MMRLGVVSVAALVCATALVGSATVGSGFSSFGVNQVLTSTVTFVSAVSTSLSEGQPIYSGAFTVLSTTGTSLQCEFVTENFTASTGQTVYLNVTSDNPIAIYVVQESSYAHWVNSGSCGNDGDAIASQVVTKSYATSVVIPNSGNWTIVLVNSSNAKNADGYLSAYLPETNYTTTQIFISTMTSTAPTATTTPTTGPQTGIPGFPNLSVILGFALGFIVILLYRRKAAPRQ